MAASRRPWSTAVLAHSSRSRAIFIYGKAGSLLAIAFDPAAARTSGAAITVIDNARTNPLNGATPFAVSSFRTVVYLAGESTGSSMTLLTATRSGQTQPLLERRLLNNQFRISPDGSRVAVSINDGQVDLWMVDLEKPRSRSIYLWRRIEIQSGVESRRSATLLLDKLRRRDPRGDQSR